MKKNLAFRSWFYFRQGWSSYFTFILATVNTLVITYYLAVENSSTLKDIFPSFSYYMLTFIIIGIPLLIFVGYVHYKRSSAFSAEADISHETNPLLYRLPVGWNTEVLYPLYLSISIFITKLSNNEELTTEEINELNELQKKLELLTNGGSIGK
jgi:hypothetical protein|tara:strand:+ start:310 stop:771 length:462 start_codon:yes stop_codon:yes gene_type:complete